MNAALALCTPRRFYADVFPLPTADVGVSQSSFVSQCGKQFCGGHPVSLAACLAVAVMEKGEGPCAHDARHHLDGFWAVGNVRLTVVKA